MCISFKTDKFLFIWLFCFLLGPSRNSSIGDESGLGTATSSEGPEKIVGNSPGPGGRPEIRERLMRRTEQRRYVAHDVEMMYYYQISLRNCQ